MSLSAGTISRLRSKQTEFVTLRNQLAGELHQLKLDQKEIDGNNVVMRKGKPASNTELLVNLKKQVSRDRLVSRQC